MFPKVSVIIPAYNGDRFMRQAIDSVLAQTYSDYEIIVVDDGSTDRTQQVLQLYGSQIRYQYQPNQGVAIARNRGIALAQGELIAFLDQDDCFLPNKLALQVEKLEQSAAEIGMVHSGWRRINAEGALLGEVEPWRYAPQLNLYEWIWWKTVLLSAMMFRRSWLERVGGLDPSFKQACDVDLALRLTLAGCQTLWLPQITVCYREHDRNDSRNTLLQAQENDRILDKFFALPNIPPEIRQQESQCRYHTLVWSAGRLYGSDRLPEMAQYLRKSLDYTPYLLTETLLDWVNSFATYFSEQGTFFSAHALTQSEEWQKLVMSIAKSQDSLICQSLKSKIAIAYPRN
ncbi:MAG: glycosyltransferase [Drouetiella hepatica Uher 2000/2452]|jgi:glycosyltransferase involved in cell wall biosynthesis|uniref:Glycosyltransferase n=1 Tax=Drouetiella hepatica Uher 2000/2452 TaxID=904376 RepID=A0A951QDH7_9CYAN|nr:glycosyltransferase [Drouetiella hepatica Uher 2000/2452]